MADASLFGKLGLWMQRFLGLYGLVLVIEVLAAFAVIAALAGVETLEPGSGRARVAGMSLIAMAGAGYVEFAAYVLIAILFLRLLYKSVQQARGFATPYSYVSAGWAVGYCFIPFINLYRPFETVKALFKSCAVQAGGDAKPAAGDQLLSAWWAMFLVSNLAGWLLARSDNDLSTPAGITTYVEYDICCNLLLLVATLLFWRVLKKLVAAMDGSVRA